MTYRRPIGNPDDPRLAERIRSIRLVAFDFDGVFTDNSVYVFQDGKEAVRCSRADGIGLRGLEQAGVLPVIISSEINPVVVERSRKLKLECFNGCADKLELLTNLLSQRGMNLDQAAFVGNDVNDLPCLRRVALPIIVRDAHPDLWPFALYQTRQLGGDGAVREVCDLIGRVLGAPSF